MATESTSATARGDSPSCSPDSPIEAATDYLARRWHPVPLAPASKKPRGGKGWQSRRYEPSDFHGDDNIGVLLGPPSDHLVDIDLDIREARELAAHLLSELPTFGRAGAPGGHRLVRCVGAPPKIQKLALTGGAAQFAAERLRLAPESNDKAVVLELRSNGQTMFPPSLHPSGERVVWADGAAPNVIPEALWDDLQKRARLLAFLAVVLRAYPREAGCRDEVCMALTGVLLRLGSEEEEVDELVTLVARLAEDEEAGDRGGKAAATRERLDAEEPTTGLPRLCELLDLAPLEKILRKWLGIAEEPAEAPGDVIVMRGGALTQIVNRAEGALLEADAGIYQRGETLVRVARIDVSSDEEGVRRDRGTTVLRTVREPWLVEQMGVAIPWFVPTLSGDLAPADPSTKYARTLLERMGRWRFAVLRGLTRAPTLDHCGAIAEVPGYDPGTQLYLDFAEGDFPPVPERPKRADAESALKRLDHLLRGFPFVDEAARSVALSAMLTGLVRRSLRTAPLHAFDAPTAGTGKSLLAETIGIIVTGHCPAAISQGKSAEEDEKRFATLLRAGDPVLLIDNCERPLQGDFLCSMLTQEIVQARILGLSERVQLPTSVLVLATGNNLTLAGDMTRRAVVCRLNAGVEQPDAREFDFDPRQEAEDARPELVVAGLTALRAYHVAGRPTSLKPVGSFEDWSLVRETLVWSGRSDPADTRAEVLGNDPRRDELVELLAAWEAGVGGEPLTLAQLRAWAKDRSEGDPLKNLVRLLENRAGRGVWDPLRLGNYLRRYRDRLVGGRRLVVDGTTGGAQRWRLEGGTPHEPELKFEG